MIKKILIWGLAILLVLLLGLYLITRPWRSWGWETIEIPIQSDHKALWRAVLLNVEHYPLVYLVSDLNQDIANPPWLLHKSQDGGKTWEQIAEGQGKVSQLIALTPESLVMVHHHLKPNENSYLVEENTIFSQSQDSGKSWQEVARNPFVLEEIKIVTPLRWLGRSLNPATQESAIYQSLDGGKHWNPFITSFEQGIYFDPSMQNTYLVLKGERLAYVQEQRLILHDLANHQEQFVPLPLDAEFMSLYGDPQNRIWLIGQREQPDFKNLVYKLYLLQQNQFTEIETLPEITRDMIIAMAANQDDFILYVLEDLVGWNLVFYVGNLQNNSFSIKELFWARQPLAMVPGEVILASLENKKNKMKRLEIR